LYDKYVFNNKNNLKNARNQLVNIIDDFITKVENRFDEIHNIQKNNFINGINNLC